MKTVADLVASYLHQVGVDVVFGLPGGENVHLLDAFRAQGMEFVLCHHESSAVFMADATARLTRKPGVCLTTLGPGATNAVTGVAHAYLDRSPVLVLTAQVPETIGVNHTHQNIDLHALFEPITKASLRLSLENTTEILNHALHIATSGRPGPVHLELSNEVARSLVGEQPAAGLLSTKLRNPSGDAIDSARSLLARSRRPVVLAGLGLEPEAPYEALRTFAESLGAPVVTTPKAKGCLPEDHELSAGVVGLTQRDAASEFLDGADCIVAVGFDPVELVAPWEQAAPLIWIAPWDNDDPHLPAAVELVGRIGPALARLSRGSTASTSGWELSRIRNLRKGLMERAPRGQSTGRIRPQGVLQLVRENCRRDAIVVTDVGSHKIMAALAWPAYVPNSYLVSNGLSAMGFGLPAATAAVRCFPEKQVILFIGDGGLAMTLGELNLLSMIEGSVLIVILDDGALDLIRSQQLRVGKPVFGTTFTNPSFEDLAAAYGLPFFHATDMEACDLAIKSALRRRQPTMMQALIDPSSYPTAPER